MKKLFTTLAICLVSFQVNAQTHTTYEISFENAVHHEAEVSVNFTNLEEKTLEMRMSRTSPGRYALHEFAKNVYDVSAFDSQGNELEITRPNPHQWNVTGHDGEVTFRYTLFANRGDGTYSQVDETHAHLNIPATFAWARNYEHRPIEITFNLREDLNWKVATQLKPLEGNTFFAPDLYYFLDSPVEIADFHLREQEVNGQNIRLALHTPADDSEVDDYFEKVMRIVDVQREVFGELPVFDYGEYTFLSCYMPNASGDGMEHRNSTVVTSSKPLDQPLGETSMGTMSHEFFHIWNIERIRPASLEPFDFEEANMSGELWFGEGFTSYYTNLTLVRAGLTSASDYIQSLSRSVGYVINSPGRNYHNPIEMSYQAPFVDAARSVDPTNRSNTFISYYTYGSVLGLALDMELRTMDGNLNLDGFMKQVWQNFGKPEIPYSVRDIQSVLADYTTPEFAEEFFSRYIYDSEMPDFQDLFSAFGITFTPANPSKASMGAALRVENGKGVLRTNAPVSSPLYEAGIEMGDELISVGGTELNGTDIDQVLSGYEPGDEIEIVFERLGERKTVTATLAADNSYSSEINDRSGRAHEQLRNNWLKAEE